MTKPLSNKMGNTGEYGLPNVKILFKSLKEDTEVKADTVKGGAVAGRVYANFARVGDIAETGYVSSGLLAAKNVYGEALTVEGKVTSVQQTGMVHALSLIVSKSIDGEAIADFLTAKEIGPLAKVRAQQEVIVTNLCGQVEAHRLKFKRRGALHRVPGEFEARAIVDELVFPGVKGNITVDRLKNLFDNNNQDDLFWSNGRKTTHGIFLTRSDSNFESTRWEIRRSGKIVAFISLNPKYNGLQLEVTPGYQ